MSNYYQKYLKYKNKYLVLKASVGGGRCYGYKVTQVSSSVEPQVLSSVEPQDDLFDMANHPGYIPCKCTGYVQDKNDSMICLCGHTFQSHGF